MTPKKTPKNAKIIICKICDFKCSKNSDYKRHLSTDKHLMLQDATITNANSYTKQFNCECGNGYMHSSSYYRHKKKCGIINNIQDNNSIQHSNINSMNNNKTFNIQLFLNNTCKDAMNMTDFVNNMKIELDDLENTGRTNYIEGISNIVIKNLNKLEQHMRPLHCSDLKREVLYIKDNNKWTKETETKPILTKAIKTIANQNIKQISKWKDNYPDCTQSDSKKNDLYLKIVSNSMNGLTKEEGEKNINKIINNVAKNVVIEK